MTLQVWKQRGEHTARITFRCPWCDVTGVSQSHGHYAGAGAYWLLASCVEPSCARAVMIRVVSSSPTWDELDVGGDGLLLNRRSIHPHARPDYDVEGVPPAIAADMVEAFRCHAAGLWVSASLMALRAMDRAIAHAGGRGVNLLAAIRSVSVTALDIALQELASTVSLLSADRTTAAPRDSEVARLLVFAEEVLHNLFVTPARLTIPAS